MSGRAPDRRAAAALDALRRAARGRGETVQRTLTRYGLERLLYRLGRSPDRDRFVLKGALLFVAWDDTTDRATRDIDLLGRGDEGKEALGQVLAGLCAMVVDEDAVRFDADSIRIESIRPGAGYGGWRARLSGRLGSARLAVALDIGFGDAVTPGPVKLRFPTLLDEAAPELLAYPAETVVAEKLEAIVALGIRTTRMKDYHDLHALLHGRAFDGKVLAEAITNTFARRRTMLPSAAPTALTAAFARDERSVRLWQAFVSTAGLPVDGPSFDAVCERLVGFLSAPIDAARERRALDAVWPPGGPWSDPSRAGVSSPARRGPRRPR